MSDKEAQIEQAFWDFDAERKRTGAERDAFKNNVRLLVMRAQQHSRQPCVMCDNNDGHLTHKCPRD